MAIRQALESERKAEQDFVETARGAESAPRGWPAALVMFHLGMWRERLRNALTNISEGKDYERPPANIDEVNEAELARGIGTPLTDAAARSDHLLAEIIELYEKLGDRPIDWSLSQTTTEAVLRNSFTHPRTHIAEYTARTARWSAPGESPSKRSTSCARPKRRGWRWAPRSTTWLAAASRKAEAKTRWPF